MTTARVVIYDASGDTYLLPPEHAAALTRAAGPANLARTMQVVALMATVEAQLIACFHDGSGVPYSAYEDFHRLMAEESEAFFDAALVDAVVPLVADLAERLAAGIDVADVGCGSGHAVNLLASAFPASRFVGYDFAAEGIETARSEAHAQRLTNAEFVLRDVAELRESERFDLVTAFDAIHDHPTPIKLVRTSASVDQGQGIA